MSDLQMATVSEPTGSEGLPTRPIWWKRVLLDSGYALSSLAISLPAFVVVVTLLSTGLGLVITLLGLPVLVLTVHVARAFARLERWRVRTLLHQPAPSPAYLRRGRGESWVRRILVPLRDPQAWLDVVWSVLGLATALVAFCVTAVWWVVALGGVTYGFWVQLVPEGDQTDTLASLVGLGESRTADVLVQFLIGVLAAATLPLVVRLAVIAHSGLARLLLSSRAEFQEEVTRIQGSRDGDRAAEAGALRRLERDIHDGPQQRLVRLAMDLGRARKMIDTDPAQAREILDGALVQARETIDELRSLSRGIAPPILVDRGLRAALEELVARSPIPVDLSMDLPRLRAPHVETAAYFVVAEALTNVAKHSRARAAHVVVSEVNATVLIEVTDDGVGGAHASKGHGLAGLDERVRAVDGTLAIASPEGGPTTLRAEIPCAS